MTAPSDLTDPVFRDAMQRVETLLDDGDYAGACKATGETYLALLEKRPDLVAGASTGPHTPLSMSRAIAWPPNGGLLVRVEEGKPALVFAKDRFSMSEAYGYFEFMLNLLGLVEKEQER
jgi:hypothetical protein